MLIIVMPRSPPPPDGANIQATRVNPDKSRQSFVVLATTIAFVVVVVIVANSGQTKHVVGSLPGQAVRQDTIKAPSLCLPSPPPPPVFEAKVS